MLKNDLQRYTVSTNQVGTVMFASILQHTKCFFRLLEFVVNTEQTHSITVKT